MKRSERIGVGIARYKKGKFDSGWVVVANYSPPGNCIGYFAGNVLEEGSG